MGLSVRALQNAGVVQYELNCFGSQFDNLYVGFRAALKNRDFDKNRTDVEKKAYKILEDNLMINTIRKTCGLVIILSKIADNKLREVKSPSSLLLTELVNQPSSRPF